MHVWVNGLLLVVVMLVTTTLRADASPPTNDELLRRAEAALSRGEIGEAIEAFDAVIREAQTSRQARRARIRRDWIEARRQGGYGPLATLQRYLARPQRERTRERVNELEHAISTMPTGLVRAEASRVVGAEWMRLGQAERAAATFASLAHDPSLPSQERPMLIGEWSAALRAAGRHEEALAVLAQRGQAEGARARMLVRERTARWARPLAMMTIGLTFAFGVVLAARTSLADVLRRVVSLESILRIAYVSLVPLVIASAYDEETFDTFAWLGLGVAGVLLCAQLLSSALRERDVRSTAKVSYAMRLGSALLLVASTLSMAYLVLDKSGSTLGILP